MAVFLIVTFDIFLFVRGDWYCHWSIDWRHYSLELQVNLSRIAFSLAEINRTWYKLLVACLYSQESVLFVRVYFAFGIHGFHLSFTLVGDPSKFITFYGLRTHSEIRGKPVSEFSVDSVEHNPILLSSFLLTGQPFFCLQVTELVYVHSKMMIVDDNTVIIGSGMKTQL